MQAAIEPHSFCKQIPQEAYVLIVSHIRTLKEMEVVVNRTFVQQHTLTHLMENAKNASIRILTRINRTVLKITAMPTKSKTSLVNAKPVICSHTQLYQIQLTPNQEIVSLMIANSSRSSKRMVHAPLVAHTLFLTTMEQLALRRTVTKIAL